MMKKYTTPSLKVITAFSEDIIQTSGTPVVPKTVAKAPAGLPAAAPATPYTPSDFGSVYGSASVAD